ncbi:hypothetical protein R5R35_006744 [Gryllus longicercus]|uniref:Uncharacterized protein n=1 Tax=Gryllus longicercus TaxID=2509291 RepID=A0AAN9Z922_9ORTH
MSCEVSRVIAFTAGCVGSTDWSCGALGCRGGGRSQVADLSWCVPSQLAASGPRSPNRAGSVGRGATGAGRNAMWAMNGPGVKGGGGRQAYAEVARDPVISRPSFLRGKSTSRVQVK